MTEQIYVVFSFHGSSTQSDRDADIAYLDQYLEPLVKEVSAFKSYEIARENEIDPELKLVQKFGSWGQDSCYPRSDWQYEVANNDTNLGYWGWLLQQYEIYEEDDEYDSND